MVEPIVSEEAFAETKQQVQEFLKSGGPELQKVRAHSNALAHGRLHSLGRDGRGWGEEEERALSPLTGGLEMGDRRTWRG